eukprot:m.144474 g.144474  ORF g.144474 m.144474 type:complete len:384 (+) comp14923_c0_seq9:155-1306(+)
MNLFLTVFLILVEVISRQRTHATCSGKHSASQFYCCCRGCDDPLFCYWVTGDNDREGIDTCLQNSCIYGVDICNSPDACRDKVCPSGHACSTEPFQDLGVCATCIPPTVTTTTKSTISSSTPTISSTSISSITFSTTSLTSSSRTFTTDTTLTSTVSSTTASSSTRTTLSSSTSTTSFSKTSLTISTTSITMSSTITVSSTTSSLTSSTLTSISHDPTTTHSVNINSTSLSSESSWNGLPTVDAVNVPIDSSDSSEALSGETIALVACAVVVGVALCISAVLAIVFSVNIKTRQRRRKELAAASKRARQRLGADATIPITSNSGGLLQEEEEIMNVHVGDISYNKGPNLKCEDNKAMDFHSETQNFTSVAHTLVEHSATESEV